MFSEKNYIFIFNEKIDFMLVEKPRKVQRANFPTNMGWRSFLFPSTSEQIAILKTGIPILHVVFFCFVAIVVTLFEGLCSLSNSLMVLGIVPLGVLLTIGFGWFEHLSARWRLTKEKSGALSD